MNRTLLYIVRNNFQDGAFHNHSILGVFSTLEKAYIAGRDKWLEQHENHLYMELKVVQPNMEDYLGCSAYNLDFSKEYSKEELAQLDQEIQNWCMWKNFEAAQHQKEYNRLFKEFCAAPDEDEFLKSKKGFEIIRLVTLMIGYNLEKAIVYIKEQKTKPAA